VHPPWSLPNIPSSEMHVMYNFSFVAVEMLDLVIQTFMAVAVKVLHWTAVSQ